MKMKRCLPAALSLAMIAIFNESHAQKRATGFDPGSDSAASRIIISPDTIGMPNAVTVGPQLTDYVGTNSKGNDIYRLKDGMMCIVPGINYSAKMPNSFQGKTVKQNRIFR